MKLRDWIVWAASGIIVFLFQAVMTFAAFTVVCLLAWFAFRAGF